MSAPERKRRLTDEVGDASLPIVAPSRPPLKKRFTSCINIQQPVVVAEPEPMPIPKPVKVEFSVKINYFIYCIH